MAEREVKIPETLYKRIERVIEGTSFESVSQFVTYVLREFLADMGAREDLPVSQEDREKIVERLRKLGYI